MSMMETVATLTFEFRSAFDAVYRASGTTRSEIAREVLHLSRRQAKSARVSGQLEKLIDQRIYFGRSIRTHEAWPDLDAIAADLSVRVALLKRDKPDRPVFLSPFHYVSQYANIYVAEKIAELLGLSSLSVVSGVVQNQYGNDHALIPGIKVLYTYGDENRNGLGVRVARAIKRDGVAVLFADVPPFTMHEYPMETVSVSMFGRDARVHNGIFRMGKSFDAVMVPFYLRFERGHFQAHVFDHVRLTAPDAPRKLADCIQLAMNDNFQQWLPAAHPAMYAFAPSR